MPRVLNSNAWSDLYSLSEPVGSISIEGTIRPEGACSRDVCATICLNLCFESVFRHSSPHLGGNFRWPILPPTIAVWSQDTELELGWHG